MTVKDIAKEAGVSPSTVSRVLNGYPHIRKETRARVEKVINLYDFKPDEIARSLINKKTNTLGLIVDDLSNPFFSETSKIIINNARKRGYEVLLYNTDNRSDDLEKTLKLLMNKQVSGIIAGSISRKEQAFEELHESGFPIALFNRKIEDSEVFSVTMDNREGAILAVKHLIERGHKRIAYLSGPLDYSTFYDRYEGYRYALGKFEIEFDESLVYMSENMTDVYMSENMTESIYAFVTELLKKENRPTAFIGASDYMAISVLAAVTRIGYEIPKDVAVMGFDNINISSHPYIGLTTISQQKSIIADLALQKLIDMVEHENWQSLDLDPIIIEPKLIIRKTT